jgi:hypothetical protein
MDRQPGPLSTTPYLGSGFGSSLRNFLPGWQAVRLRDDFRAGLEDWVGPSGAGLDWSREGGLIRPGKLRRWEPSLKFADYQLEFEGRIERKAMGWTFRSGSLENYYATKIGVSGAGASARAEVVRYVALGGKEFDRTQLPLPMCGDLTSSPQSTDGSSTVGAIPV